MDEGYLGSQFSLIYDGSEDNNNLEFLKEGLENGMLYTFRAYALNFNGMSVASETATYYACTAPTGFARPEIVSQTQSQIIIDWVPPTDDGGCRITSYVVYRDDGQGGDISTEVNLVEDPAVRDLPSLNQLTVTNFPADSLGLTFRFQLKVITT